MASMIAELEAKIRSLSPEEKTELLRSLIAELEGPERAEIDDQWIAAATQRYRQIADGTVTTIPGDRVFEKVRSQLKR